MKQTILLLAAVNLLRLFPALSAQPAQQQPSGPTQTDTSVLPGVLQWLQSKATTTAGASNQAAVDKSSNAAAADAGKSTPKQTQSISIDHGSTTLLDQTSGADLLSSALNLVPVSSGTAAGGTSGNSGTQGSGTVTASAYGIWALFHPKQDSLAPDNYNSHVAWRRFFFTVGREQSGSNSSNSNSSNSNSSNMNSSGATTSAAAILPRATTPTSTSSTTKQPGTVAGVQVLIVQKRDASNIVNDVKALDPLRQIAFNAAAINGKYTTAMIRAICAPKDSDCEAKVTSSGKDAVQIVQAEIDKLSPARKDQVNQLATTYSNDVEKADVTNRLNQAIQMLQHRPQLSLNFQTTQRTNGQPDDYLGEVIYDQGFAKDWLFTFNGSYDYSNSSMIGADLRTERAALQLGRTLISPGTHLKSPLQLNLAGEGVHQDTGWHYRAQLQLVVPITNGINLPLSFGYGNETNALRQEEKGVFGKFGLTLDFQKILDTLHTHQQ